MVKFLCKTHWGSDPSTLLTLYKSFVRSVLEFNCFIYFPKNKTQIEKLEKIQYAAFRSALGYRNTIPRNILLAESKLPLITERAKFLCDCQLTKSISNNNSDTYKMIKRLHCISTKHSNIKTNRLLINRIRNLDFIQGNIDSQSNYNIYTHSYQTLLTSIPFRTDYTTYQVKNDDVQVIQDNTLALYTDGSKIQLEGKFTVGSACICPQLNYYSKHRLNEFSSVFTAECVALNEAFDIALKNLDKNICIYTDPLSALQTLKSTKNSIKINSYILDIKSKHNSFNS